jgi:cell division protein FtsI (penicillin-binding protein 3)
VSAQRIWKPGDLRLLVIGVAFVLAWAGIGFRLFDLQGNQARAAELATVGFDQRITERAIEPARGTIYDRDGVELALTIDGWNIVVDPSMLDDPAATAALLAPYADRKDEVESVVAAYNSDVDKAQRITGVFYRPQPLRVYPAGSVASQVIGLTGYDGGGGIEGLELTFNSELEGDAGRLIVELDPSGRVIPQGEVLLEPATAGADIVTTIDREIQFAAEQALRRAIQSGAGDGELPRNGLEREIRGHTRCSA